MLHEGFLKCDSCFFLRAGCHIVDDPKSDYAAWYDDNAFTRGKSPSLDCSAFRY